jgi:purine-binding chemotaxis protein CheW
MNEPENFAKDFEDTGTLDQEQVEQIWAQRAALMAQVEVEEEPGEQLVVMLFRLGRELLGIEVRYVQDIRQKETLTQVPRVPEWVAGVTNLRGRILSVIDLRAYLGLPPSPQPEAGFFVQIRSAAMELIFLVDDVPDVEVLPVRHDLTGDRLIHHLRAEYVQAVVERRNSPVDQRHVTVLNVEALLADPRLVIHEELA